jgi:uncharacterized protein YndB with AHSA1/START domain
MPGAMNAARMTTDRALVRPFTDRRDTVLLCCSTLVDASADTVFACVDDPEHIVQWVSGAVEHKYVTERNGDSRVGQRFRQRLKQGSGIREFDGEVIAWEPPTHFGLSIPSPAYSSEAHFRITPEGPIRSTVRYTIDVTLHSPVAKVLGPILRLPLGLFVKEQIRRLKVYAESLQARRDAAAIAAPVSESQGDSKVAHYQTDAGSGANLADRSDALTFTRRSTALGMVLMPFAQPPQQARAHNLPPDLSNPASRAGGIATIALTARAGEPAPATALRPLQRGDTWTYAVTGTLTPPGSKPLPLSGDITVAIVPDALSGTGDALAIRFARSFQVTQPDGSRTDLPAPVMLFSVVQDSATHDVAIAADNMGHGGKPRTAKVPQVFYPGAWSRDTGYANRLDFDDGDFVVNTLAVVGQEWVDTAIGRFSAWKATVASESPVMGHIDGVDWWTPELGAPVQFSTDGGLPDGSRMHFVATLSRSTVVAGG